MNKVWEDLREEVRELKRLLKIANAQKELELATRIYFGTCQMLFITFVLVIFVLVFLLHGFISVILTVIAVSATFVLLGKITRLYAEAIRKYKDKIKRLEK